MLREASEGAASIYERNKHPALLRRWRGRGKAHHLVTVAFTRSQLREAMARLIRFGVWHCDLVGRDGLEVGRWDPEQQRVRFFDLHEIAQGLGLSYWRAQRVVSAASAAGWIYRHQGRDRELADDGTVKWSGHVARFKLTIAAFEACGISRERVDLLRREARADYERRRWKQQRSEERAPPADAAVRSTIQGVAAVSRDELRALKRTFAGVSEDATEEYARALVAVQSEHPEWDSDRKRAEARRRATRPPPPR